MARGQKVMMQPMNKIFEFLKLQKRIRVWLYDQKHLNLEGQLIGFDEFMNLVLADAEEIDLKTQEKRSIGKIMLKGDNISVMMEAPNQVAAAQ